jgi:hypothetical protein
MSALRHVGGTAAWMCHYHCLVADPEPNAKADRDVTSSQPAMQTPTRWVAPAALAIAVIAIGIAIWAPVRPTGEPAINTQPSDDAKAHVCAAVDTVRKAVSMQTNADLGPDPVAKEAVAANARLATLGGGEYLLSRLDPATPPELADPVRSFANNLQDIGMKQLVGVPNTDPGLAAQLSDAQAASQQIADLCK